ncbi:MAG: hypothetical protein Satyrvirus38_4 [Satyrvirus sp.]|uniref:Uncharacterized protein n=1 Tax=Satyrvirus sp. TaxID=2487771 RepID=A0A3G5AF13_9VIRU|nr:MAG: hypothetical protein Satyrvirus38_4 [Satyrvirus sp.]
MFETILRVCAIFCQMAWSQNIFPCFETMVTKFAFVGGMSTRS